ncbi:hypothetical protein V6Z11_A11G141400 [Gossypium hirsutum]
MPSICKSWIPWNSYDFITDTASSSEEEVTLAWLKLLVGFLTMK